MARHALPLLLLVASAAVGALACSDTRIPTAQPPPAPPPTSFAIRPALDTARLNDPPYDRVWFVAERADSTVDQWTLSDSSIAQLGPRERGQAMVFARRPGTVIITARRGGDSGQATLIIPPFTIWPIFDTIKVGEQVTFGGNHFRFPYDVIEWSSSDSARARVTQKEKNWASVLAQAAGTVTITATHHGDTARATLVIREPQPGEWESIDLGLVDSAAYAAATAITDDGTIIGYLGYLGSSPYWRGFIYRDGAMRRLPSRGGDDIPEVIGPSGKIAGTTWGNPNGGVSVWDTPDALPRQLTLETNEQGAVVRVNQRGDVLFTATTRPGDYAFRSRAVLWRDGVSVDLGSLGDSTVEPWTEANAWNAKGQIVGRSHVRNREDVGNEHGDRPEFFHPFLWENGVMRDLGVLAPFPCRPGGTATDCSWGEAVDINDHGVVVGTVNSADGRTTAFIWENGVMRDLGVDPGHFSSAIAINDRGQVLGTSEIYGVFLWENGQIQSIGLGRYATALGPNGEVIGGAGVRAFFWQAGQLTDLGVGDAFAVNGNGEIAGRSGSRATLWRKKR
jgi:probable HAF family extracellular repeat protein